MAAHVAMLSGSSVAYWPPPLPACMAADWAFPAPIGQNGCDRVSRRRVFALGPLTGNRYTFLFASEQH